MEEDPTDDESVEAAEALHVEETSVAEAEAEAVSEPEASTDPIEESNVDRSKEDQQAVATAEDALLEDTTLDLA